MICFALNTMGALTFVAFVPYSFVMSRIDRRTYGPAARRAQADEEDEWSTR